MYFATTHPFSAQKYLFTPILFVGADVTHPDPGDMKSPSITAVCSNIDNHPNKYIGFEMVQRNRLEIISQLKTAIKQSLISYYRNTRLKPDKLIFYRDGVSEGQFNEVCASVVGPEVSPSVLARSSKCAGVTWIILFQVLIEEMGAIRTACMELDPSYKPAITFIVVQKRHNTRFFKKHINERDRPIVSYSIVGNGMGSSVGQVTG